MQKPYNVLDVCHYIVKYCYEKKYLLSNLRLQKLLYFIQAYFLVKTEYQKKCFEQKIEAWDFGPIVPEAYQEYKQFGSGQIEYSPSKRVLNENFVFIEKKYEDVIYEKDKKYILEVIEELKKYSTYTLVDITHRQKPWKEAYSSGCGTEITCESIQEYFS